MELDFKKPTLEVLNLIHRAKICKTKSEELRNFLVKEGMISLYEKYYEEDLIPFDKNEHKLLKEKNQKIIDKIKKEIEENSDNEAIIYEKEKELAEFYAQTLDLVNCEFYMKKITSINPSISLNMDVLLCKIRMSLILKNVLLLENSIVLARNLCESGCDWDRKNKFKVYEAMFSLKKGDFKRASLLFSESLSTFDTKELFSFNKLCLYTIFTGLLSFKRNEIYEKILTSSNILEEKESLEMGIKLADSLYNCNYSVILENLYMFVCQLSTELHLKKYIGIFLKEILVKAYKQLLSSYKTLSLQTMADIFNIDVKMLEDELIYFIYTDKLNCKIDRVAMSVSVVEESHDYISEFVERGDDVLRCIKKRLN